MVYLAFSDIRENVIFSLEPLLLKNFIRHLLRSKCQHKIVQVIQNLYAVPLKYCVFFSSKVKVNNAFIAFPLVNCI